MVVLLCFSIILSLRIYAPSPVLLSIGIKKTQSACRKIVQNAKQNERPFASFVNNKLLQAGI